MTNPKMKTKINFSKICKAFLVAGLVAAPFLAFNAKAENQDSESWTPEDIFTDANGNQYAYWNDPLNWSSLEVPMLTDTNTADADYGYYWRIFFNAAPGAGAGANAYVACVVTNDTVCEQIIDGNGAGGGTLIVTNGASLSTGLEGEWTGVGFEAGPAYLLIEPGSTVTMGSHLWAGQGVNNFGEVVINNGTLQIGGQLGLGWNGTGGTNYMFVTNNSTLYLNQWASATLGEPGNASTGILDLDTGSSIVITNNYGLSSFQPVTNLDELISDEGTGTIIWSYNSADNLTTVSAVLPVGFNTPVFSVQPTNTLVSIGSTVTLRSLVSNVPVNYGWYFNGSAITNGNGISGAQTANLTITGITSAQTGSYSVYATNSNTGDSSYFVLSNPASVSAQAFGLYPVVTLNGTVGNTYEVQYTSSLSGTPTWTTLGTYTTISSPQYVPDFSAPLNSSRFYQVIQTGTVVP
jgi:hypothetical protein